MVCLLRGLEEEEVTRREPGEERRCEQAPPHAGAGPTGAAEQLAQVGGADPHSISELGLGQVLTKEH